MNTKIFFIITIFAISCMVSFNFVSAQDMSVEEIISLDIDQAVNTSPTSVENIVDNVIGTDLLNTEIQPLEGVEIKEIEKVPTGFGLLWKDFKNSISLTFTFDKVKQAEKRLAYAEEKIKIANFIALKSDNPKVQEKAQKMIEVANGHIAKIQEKKDVLFEKMDENKIRLLNNLSIHALNTEKVLEKMENKVSSDKLEQFQGFRERFSQNKDALLDRVQSNPNIPSSTKQKILQIQNNILERRVGREQIRVENQELIQKIKLGDESAKQELEQKRLEMQEEKQAELKILQEKKAEIMKKVNSGDDKLRQQALETINKIKLENKVQEKEAIMERQKMQNRAQELKK